MSEPRQPRPSARSTRGTRTPGTWTLRWAAVAAFASSVSVAACSATATDSVATAERPSAEATPNEDAAGDESPAPSCAPAVVGLRPSAIASIEVACPGGFAARTSFAALPVAGRFGSLEEMTAAFCIASVAMKGLPSVPMGIDFETSDVVSYVFDATSGSVPTLFDGAGDLWLRTTMQSCKGRAVELRGIAFVVPKRVRINEQTCSLSCEASE